MSKKTVMMAFTQHLSCEEVEYTASGDCITYESTCDVDNLDRAYIYAVIECNHTPGLEGDWITPDSEDETDFTLTYAAVYGLGATIALCNSTGLNNLRPRIHEAFIRAAEEAFKHLQLKNREDV